MGARSPFPCPCGHVYDRVIDTRADSTGQAFLRRRRRCSVCNRRITTREYILDDYKIIDLMRALLRSICEAKEKNDAI